MPRQSVIENPTPAAVKEVLRLVVFAAASAVVAVLIDYFAAVDQTTVTAILTLVLRGVDKWIHKSDNEVKGLLPF